LQNQQYGLAYWTQARKDYADMVKEARKYTGMKSADASQKRLYLAKMRKTLKAIYRLLEANYPDVYRDKARAWGFIKGQY